MASHRPLLAPSFSLAAIPSSQPLISPQQGKQNKYPRNRSRTRKRLKSKCCFHGMYFGTRAHVTCFKSQLQRAEAGLAGCSASSRLPVGAPTAPARVRCLGAISRDGSLSGWCRMTAWWGRGTAESALNQNPGSPHHAALCNNNRQPSF